MRQQTVALHLAEADAAVALATFNRLSRERVNGTCRAHLELVGDHVAQTLVVDDAHEDVGLELASVDAAVHALRSEVVVAG